MIKSGLDELSPKRLVPQRGEVVFILGELRWCGLALAAVRDLREWRSAPTEEELADYETDLLARFVLARASAGLTDSTIRNDTNHGARRA